MIPKLICKLFGHIKFTDVFIGQIVEITDQLTGQLKTIPIVKPEVNDICPRCGESF